MIPYAPQPARDDDQDHDVHDQRPKAQHDGATPIEGFPDPRAEDRQEQRSQDQAQTESHATQPKNQQPPIQWSPLVVCSIDNGRFDGAWLVPVATGPNPAAGIALVGQDHARIGYACRAAGEIVLSIVVVGVV